MAVVMVVAGGGWSCSRGRVVEGEALRAASAHRRCQTKAGSLHHTTLLRIHRSQLRSNTGGVRMSPRVRRSSQTARARGGGGGGAAAYFS